MNYPQAINYLYNLEHFGIKLGLDNINFLLDQLDRPERKFPSIHVAGTNGKGSVCAYLTHILMEAGYRVGRLISPHIVDYRERISINNEPIPEDEVVRWVQKISPCVDAERITYFETTTAIAFGYFAEQDVDIAVIEVGLGGRLDATNVITPLVSVITDIDLEHTNVLGATLPEIAREKAGIIKPGVPVVVTSLHSEVKQVFRTICEERNAPLHHLEDHCRIENVALNRFGTLFDVYLDRVGYFDVTAALIGNFQPRNAMAAVLATQLLPPDRFKITEEHFRHGLQTTQWPGRFQIVRTQPTIIVDGGHNPAGAGAFVSTFKAVFGDRKARFMFAVLGKKDYQPMIRILNTIASELILPQLQTHRALSPTELLAQLPPTVNVPTRHFPSVTNALDSLLQEVAADEIVVIVGSLYLAGEALAYFQDPAHQSAL